MKNLISYFVLALIVFPKTIFSQLSLDIVYPREEQVVTAFDSTFIFGSVSNPLAVLHVNEIPVKVYPNGAFLGVVPVTSGNFIFSCTATVNTDTIRVSRNVFIPPYLSSTPSDTVAIDSNFIFPNEDIELSAGDYLQVAFKGTPGLLSSCSILGLIENGAMAEASPWKEFYWGEAVFGEDKPPITPEIRGVYHGVFKIPNGTELSNAEIEFQVNGANGTIIKAKAKGKISVRNDIIPRIAELNKEWTVARTGPGLGYQQFLPKGVRLWITGKKGHYCRARLNDVENIWVPEDNLIMLPPGTPIPSSTISLVRTESLEKKVRVKIYLQERLPFKIEQIREPASLIISVYGAISDTDWIRYDFGDPALKEIRWLQPTNEVYQLIIEFHKKQQWGFNPYYEGTNLIVEIKRPPKKLSLKELLICIDPGHGPDDGAVGPTRLKEKDANLKLSLILKEQLEKKGAKVFLTRKDHHGASLSVRPKMAAFLEADILVSIHNNALPDGVNPFISRGSSAYYYHVQSQPLAAAVLKRLLDKLKLPNFGLYYDNLALCRPPQMPAVLIEPAFIMHPEEEALINSYKYQKKTSDAIIKGIEDFLKASKK